MQKKSADDQYKTLTAELAKLYPDDPNLEDLEAASSNLVRFFELLTRIEEQTA